MEIWLWVLVPIAVIVLVAVVVERGRGSTGGSRKDDLSPTVRPDTTPTDDPRAGPFMPGAGGPPG
jgi:hypothetical protein